MPNSRGFSNIFLIVVVLLLAALGAGNYLLRNGTNFFTPDQAPKQSGFILKELTSGANVESQGYIEVSPNQSFSVNLWATNNNLPASTFGVKIRFPHDIVSLANTDSSNLTAAPVNWTEQLFNNTFGLIQLSGQFYPHEFKSENPDQFLLTRINFKVKPGTEGRIEQLELQEDGTYMKTKAGDPLPDVTTKSIEIRINKI